MTDLTPLGVYDMWVYDKKNYDRPSNQEIEDFLSTLDITDSGRVFLMDKVRNNVRI